MTSIVNYLFCVIPSSLIVHICMHFSSGTVLSPSEPPLPYSSNHPCALLYTESLMSSFLYVPLETFRHILFFFDHCAYIYYIPPSTSTSFDTVSPFSYLVPFPSFSEFHESKLYPGLVSSYGRRLFFS